MASEQQKEQARAAWESATVANLGPLLPDERADALWEAIVEFRTATDSVYFVASMHEIASTGDATLRAAIERVIASIPAPE